MAFPSHVVSGFSFYATSLLSFLILWSPPLPIYGAGQRQPMIEFASTGIKTWSYVLGIGRELLYDIILPEWSTAVCINV